MDLATRFPSNCVSHIVSPRPLPIPHGPPPTLCTSVTTPSVVIRVNTPARYFVNQRLPSGPVIMLRGLEKLLSLNSVMTPAGVIRPILFPKGSVNHRFPSGPVVILEAPSFVGPNSVILPETSMRPILLA